MVKQCGQNRLNAEREGANLEFQVVIYTNFKSSVKSRARGLSFSHDGQKRDLPALKIKL